MRYIFGRCAFLQLDAFGFCQYRKTSSLLVQLVIVLSLLRVSAVEPSLAAVEVSVSCYEGTCCSATETCNRDESGSLLLVVALL